MIEETRSWLRTTLQTLYRIFDIQWKRESASAFGARDDADTAYINVRGADAIIDDDFVTKRQLATAGGTASIEVPFIGAAGTYDSVALLPAGSRVFLTYVDIDSALDGAATVDAGTPALPSSFISSVPLQSDPSVVDLYVKNQYVPIGVAVLVRVTIGGAPTVGSGTVLVFYTVPLT